MKVLLRRVALNRKAILLFNNIPYIIIILVGLALYINTFNNAFVWDDEYLIEKNIHIKSWEKLPEIFVSSLSLPSPKQGNFYRPFQVISFLFDYSFWKLNPVGYHITNLFFHILNALLLYILIKILLQDNLAFRNFNDIDSSAAPQNDKKKCHSERSEESNLVYRNFKNVTETFRSPEWKPKGFRYSQVSERSESNLTSLLAALLFLIHPIHTEAVTYISGRADPIVTSICLMSLILFLKATYGSLKASVTDPVKRRLFYLGSIVSFLCALLSKETALIFPFLLVWCGYSFRRRPAMHAVAETFRSPGHGRLKFATANLPKERPSVTVLPFFLLSVLYVALRLTLLKAISEPHPPIAPFFSRVITFFNVIVRYIILLFFPQDLHMERRIPFLNSLFQAEAILSLVLVCVLIFVIIWLHKYSKEAGFGLGWFLIALLPVSNIMPINAAMAEHWLYMPSIGFFLAVVVGVSSLWRYFNIEILRYAQNDRKKCHSEHSEESILLWRAKALRYMFILLFTAFFVFCSIGTIKQNLVWNNEISLYNSILKFSHSSARIHINLGVAYAKRDEYDKAITEYKKAIELYPDFVMTYINMGYMYSKKGMNEEAVRAYKAALSIRPYVATYISDELKLIYSDKEVSEMTSHQYSGHSLSNLELADLYNNVALIYDKEGKFSDAVRMYKKAIETNPEYTDARINLGILYRKKEVYNDAIYEFNELLKIDKDSIDGHFNLGFIYDRLGRYEEALSEYKEVVRIKPRDVKAYNNLGTAYGKLGMHLEAILRYKRALYIDPNFGMSHFNLGSAYANKGEMDKAVEEWEKALQLDPDLEAAKLSLEKAKK